MAEAFNVDFTNIAKTLARDIPVGEFDAISFYTIGQVILSFWLVLAYDLVEDRYTIDVINTKFFPSVFFENQNGGVEM